jgi:hypothetical protein
MTKQEQDIIDAAQSWANVALADLMTRPRGASLTLSPCVERLLAAVQAYRAAQSDSTPPAEE